MDSVEKTVDNLIKYCKSVKCENCVFNFRGNLQEDDSCGINIPSHWKGINQDRKNYLLEVNKNKELQNDLQKSKSEVEYYKQIYFGGNVTYGEE